MRKELFLSIGLLCTPLNPFNSAYAEDPPARPLAVEEINVVEPKEEAREGTTPEQDPLDPPIKEESAAEQLPVMEPQKADNEGTRIGKDSLNQEELAAAEISVREPNAKKREPLGLILGLRTGLSIPTQKVIQDFGNSTSIGPLINFEVLYALREWVRVGMMLEWHRHSIKMWGPEFGTLNIVSILPTIEFRPTRDAMEERGIEAFIPYASIGLGVNSNSLSKGSGLGNATVSFRDTFALRLAGGLDFPITSHWALNGELAWNKNSGDYQLNGTNGSFNASSLNLLVGIRAQF